MKKTLIIAASLTILAAAGWFGATAYANSIARQQIDKELLEARDTADIRYDDVDVNLMTKSVSIKDVSIAPPQGGEPILVEEVVVNEFDQDSAVPAFLSARIIGAEINVDALGEFGAGIRQLGYPQIVKISSDVSYRYDDLARELEVRDLSLEAADVGTLEARFKIGNFQLGSGQEALFRLMFGYPNILIHGAELSFSDNSLVKRVMQQRGREEGTSSEEATANVLAEVDAQIAATNDPLGKDILSQFRQFIDSPDTFSVTVQPEAPLKIRDIPRSSDPVNIARMLNLQVKG